MNLMENNNLDKLTPLYKLVQRAFEQTLSLPNFGSRYVFGGDQPNQQQLFESALVAQALRYHTSKERRDGLLSLTNPVRVLSQLAVEYRTRIYNDRVSAKRVKQKMAAAERHQTKRKQIEEKLAASFVETHSGMPQMYSAQEIAKLNASRPVHDQLEWTSSGLCRHHCTYPKCPLFLQSLATSMDIEKNRRNGLFFHLEPLIRHRQSKHLYYQGFHLRSLTYLRTSQPPNRQAFVQEMTNKIDAWADKENVKEMRHKLYVPLLTEMWDQFHSIKQ